MSVYLYILAFLAAVGALIAAIYRLPAAQAKQRLEIVHSIIATAAIIVGAIWVWDQFSRERQGIPRLTTTQEITSYPIPTDQILLNVRSTLANTGKTKITAGRGFTRVQQILPLDPNVDKTLNPGRHGKATKAKEIRDSLAANASGVINWPLLCKRYWKRKIVIEPDETHLVDEQFLLPATVELVRVYTYIHSPGDQALGYEMNTMHLLDKNGESKDDSLAKTNLSSARLLCNIEPKPDTDPE